MASSSKPKPSRTRKTSSTSTTSSRRSSSSTTTKTPIYINIYDLLPPGRLSSLLWTLGSSLLHSGVVIPLPSNPTREYAFGGHNKPSTTGVYSTPPAYAPPGATHRSSILAGFSSHSPDQIEEILKSISERFLGPRYNLLTNNCNHFTSALVLALTGKAAPNWLNRAAGIGLALPCVVPREWISPPDMVTAEGQLLDEREEEDEDDVIARAVYKDHDDGEDEDEEVDERASMLESERHRRLRDEQRRQREVELRSRREAQQQRQGSGSGSKRLSVASINRSMSLAGSVVTTATTRRSSSVEQDNDDGDVVGQSLAGGKRITTVDEPPARLVKRVDSAGRGLPVAERAPVPKAAAIVTTSSRT